MNEAEVIREMLGDPPREPRTLAVVGLSDRPDRPSHYVSVAMRAAGYGILPVNPTLEEVLGQPCYRDLASLPVRPDVVNVFRLPGVIPTVVEEMIALKLTRLWVQQGIVNLDAARRAEAAGIKVVMDRCILIEQRRRVG